MSLAPRRRIPSSSRRWNVVLGAVLGVSLMPLACAEGGDVPQPAEDELGAIPSASQGALCDPCVGHQDCGAGDAIGTLCVPYGTEAAFCAERCDVEACPEGFQCTPLKHLTSSSIPYCVRVDLELCGCSLHAIFNELESKCWKTTEEGTCEGRRTCTAEGLTICDTPPPGPETCNGIDDDCDGLTDEEFTDTDKDGLANCVDPDDDGDGIEDDGDHDEELSSAPCKPGYVSGCDDNCLLTPNLSQADADGDGKGDACDPDSDGDGWLDWEDCLPADPTVGPCGDNNPCTTDSCEPDVGCLYVPHEQPCEDGNVCTADDRCADSTCVPGEALNCDDANACTLDLCQHGTGCAHEPIAVACDDGDACTLGDACAEGVCLWQEYDTCDDDDDCTEDHCAPSYGCHYELTTGPCDDGDACTANDLCLDSGFCAGTPLTCNDFNPCTATFCSPLEGCSPPIPLEGVACEDGDACTVDDVCSSGLCAPGPIADCDDGDDCTTDVCSDGLGCVNTAHGEACDDSDACTETDTCSLGEGCVGIPLECDEDADPCTQHYCHPEDGCQVLLELDGVGCDDGDPCSVDDSCVAGSCEGGPDPCEDEDLCTIGDVCSEDGCLLGAPIDCDDEEVCTIDFCHEAVGCLHVPVPGGCDDGDACTAADVCTDGVCAGPLEVDCDDNEVCTEDTCESESGCTYLDLEGDCDDGDICTSGEHCSQGQCEGVEEDCDDTNGCTTDFCVHPSGCVHLPNVGASCTDGEVCTLDDECGGEGTCVPGPLNACIDGNVCTDNHCESGVGCVLVYNTNPCGDGDQCTVDDTCNGAGSCIGEPRDCGDDDPCTLDFCDHPWGCQNLPLEAPGTPCDDGDVCTLDSTCDAEGLCTPGGHVDCDDDDPCTGDFCHEDSGCFHFDFFDCP